MAGDGAEKIQTGMAMVYLWVCICMGSMRSVSGSTNEAMAAMAMLMPMVTITMTMVFGFCRLFESLCELPPTQQQQAQSSPPATDESTEIDLYADLCLLISYVSPDTVSDADLLLNPQKVEQFWSNVGFPEQKKGKTRVQTRKLDENQSFFGS
eukprot:Gb_39740 [translate_table: standard]